MDERETRMEWAVYLSKAAESLMRDLKSLLPEETYDHLRGSRKEFLLAVRSLIDRQIENIDKDSQKIHRLEVQ